MIDINTASIDALQNELVAFRKMALPFATRGTINALARSAQGKSIRDVKKKFINRTEWTHRSIIYTPDRKELNIPKQKATTGTLAEYMEAQEFGATYNDQMSPKFDGVGVPRPFAAGQTNNRPTRTKAVISRMMRRQIIQKAKVIKAPRHGKLNLTGKMRWAIRSKHRYFYHEWQGGRGKGIYYVRGGDDGKSRGTIKGASLREVYDLSNRIIKVKPNPTITPASLWAMESERRTKVYRRQLLRQLKKHNIAWA